MKILEPPAGRKSMLRGGLPRGVFYSQAVLAYWLYYIMRAAKINFNKAIFRACKKACRLRAARTRFQRQAFGRQ